MQQKMPDIERLREHFRSIITGPVTVAFSGGTDSVLVLKLTLEAARNRFPVYAVYADTPWMPRAALEEAQNIAKDFQTDLHIIRLDSPQSIGIENNPKDRCYRCKKNIFAALKAFAAEHGCSILLEGTQLDDLNKYRPGLQAVRESGALSPLKDLGLHKADVRHFLTLFNIEAAKKPSGSCLATRLPYGQTLETELLKRIDTAEQWLRAFDLGTVRVRSHGEIARIEVSRENLQKVLCIHEQLTQKFKSLGWKYVTLDLEGFRSGSMD